MGNILVRQANVVLDIPEEQRDEYLAKGFDVIGANGKPIIKATPNDLNSLKKAFAELTEKVKALELENSQLKKQLNSQDTPKIEDEDPVTVNDETSDETEDFTPINKRGSRKNKK